MFSMNSSPSESLHNFKQAVPTDGHPGNTTKVEDNTFLGVTNSEHHPTACINEITWSLPYIFTSLSKFSNVLVTTFFKSNQWSIRGKKSLKLRRKLITEHKRTRKRFTLSSLFLLVEVPDSQRGGKQGSEIGTLFTRCYTHWRIGEGSQSILSVSGVDGYLFYITECNIVLKSTLEVFKLLLFRFEIINLSLTFRW